MPKDVVIHIGLPKTGTTFLQHRIQQNIQQLAKCGVYIPRTGLDPVEYSHNYLAFALQPERWSQFPAHISKILPHLWSDLVDEIDACDSRFILISAETFSWELRSMDQLQTIRRYLERYKLRIVYCARDSYDFIASMYGHMLRTGRGPYSLESFLIEFSYYWDPCFHVHRWSEIVGAENIVGLSYDELKGDLILGNFLTGIFPDQNVNPSDFDQSQPANLNTSLSPRFLRFLEELSANGMAVQPYISLYLRRLKNFSPLESRVVGPAEIDCALNACGMALNLSDVLNSSADLSAQADLGSVAHGPTPTKSEQMMGPISTTVLQELTHARQTLSDRTVRLEAAMTDLTERTHDLVATRQLLVERTAALERITLALEEQTSASANKLKAAESILFQINKSPFRHAFNLLFGKYRNSR